MAAGAYSDDRIEIEKLEGNDDWWGWKYNITLQLKAKKLWSHVAGTATLAQDAPANEREKFEHNAVRAQAMIVRALSKQVTSLILRCDGPKPVWDKLVEEFEVKSVQNTLLLRTQVNQMRLKEGSSVREHINAMKELYDRLAMLDDKVAEKDQVINLLASLPSSYNAIRSVVLARGPAITWTDTQQTLILEEQQRELQSSKRTSSGGREGKEKAIQGALRSEVICYKCHQPGHFKRDCPEMQNRTFGNNNDQSNGKRRGGGSYRGRGRGRGRGGTHGATRAESQENEDDSYGNFVFKIETGHNSRHETWLIDSGASRHMTSQKDYLSNYQQFKEKELVTLGDGKAVEALGKGDVKLHLDYKKTGTLKDVLYVPKLSCNLFSVGAATDQNLTVEFGQNNCCFKTSDGKIAATGTRVNRLYHLDFKPAEDARVAETNRLKLWHQRLGHVNQASLRQMVDKGLLNGVEIGKDDQLGFCQACVEGKKSRDPFPAGEIQTTERLQLVHSDVCGPMQTASFGGARYFVTLIDDYSRCVKVYCIRSKDQVFEKFREFEALVTNETGQKIKTLRTDGGGEYTSAKFENFLKQKGIWHEICAPYSPQQNGVAERMNRTLVESARSMIFNAGLSKAYWAEAVTTAAYVRNRVVTSSTGVTPYERWYGKKPDVSSLKVFGCMAHALVPDNERRKWDRKTQCLRFVGYGGTFGTKGYRLFDERHRKLVVRRDVTFDETDFGQKKEVVIETDREEEVEPAQPVREEHDAQSDSESGEDDLDRTTDEHGLRRCSTRSTFGVPPKKFADEFAYNHHFAYLGQINEPTTWQEALQSDYSKEWKQAADAEYESLTENNTWELVELPEERKAIACKWVFRVKYDQQGKVDRFKGRLVAKGFSQKYGIDYDETYSPVVRFTSIRVLLAWAACKQMKAHQMDVTTAFLNGDLKEEIYMTQPDGYIQPGKEHLVCRLRKSLYGLKQAPRCWNIKFVTFMKKIGFQQSEADPCIFVRSTQNNFSVLAVYVDDIVILTKTEAEMLTIKKQLSEGFKMKDMGELHYLLGVNIHLKDGTVTLDQHQYLTKLLEKFGLKDAKTVSTPLDPNVKLVKEDGYSTPVDQTHYQSLVGSLLYAAMATRPDIAHAVGVIGRFNAAPNESHMTAVKRICRYLKGTINLKLVYTGTNVCEAIGYSDADWASSLDDRHSTSGIAFIIAGGTVSWLSKRQATVALSTAEAEYVALTSAIQEAVWMRRLLQSLGESPKTLTIHEDNQGAIKMSHNPVLHSRTKHIDIRYHYIRETVADGTVVLKYCPTKDMIADLLTKPLGKGRFELLRDKLGLRYH